MTRREQDDMWRSKKFVAMVGREQMPKTITCARGEVELPPEFYGPMGEVLAANGYEPKAVDEISGDARFSNRQFHEFTEALAVLAGAGLISPIQVVTAPIAERCRRFNKYICDRALAGPSFGFLASPLAGGGIHIPHASQLFILAMEQGCSGAEALAKFAWAWLRDAGGHLTKDGRSLESIEDNIHQFVEMAEAFLERTVPLLRTHQVL